jgi:hypothetical protein
VYLAVPINLIVLGWVNKAMVTILEVSLGSTRSRRGDLLRGDGRLLRGGRAVGVLWTDAVQFVLMMTAVIVLAVYAVDHVGGMAALKAQVTSSTPAAPTRSRCSRAARRRRHQRLRVHAAHDAVRLPRGAVVGGVVPGAEPGGGGYVAQRIFASRHGARRRPRDAVLPGGALRAPAVALDRHRARDDGHVPEPRPRREGQGLRARLHGPAPVPVARADAGGLRGRVHVHRRDAAQLGRVVPRERRLPPLREADRFRVPARERRTPRHGPALLRLGNRGRGSSTRSPGRGSC